MTQHLQSGIGPEVSQQISEVFRAEHGRIVAGLIRRFGDIDLAEEAMGEALVVALEKWPRDGMPPNPAGWLTTTAGNKALDRLRRLKVRDEKYAEVAMLADDSPAEATGPVGDDRLRLIFTCCHPALAPEAQMALTLRLLGGLTVPEIAAAFLASDAAIGQRITRAKAKIKQARIPYRLPSQADVGSRLTTVLAVLYLIFNEGYLVSAGSDVRDDLCEEAIRLTRQLREVAGALGPQPEVDGLLALMLLLDARRPARVASGSLVMLPDQDRSLWDAAMIDEGHALVRGCLALNRPGPYQLQAAINAVHTDAIAFELTDWSQVVTLYDRLLSLTSSPVVALNRAVAVAELDGPQAALAIVDSPGVAGPLASYQPWHAARADLLRRIGRLDDARAAYRAAIAVTENAAERAWLEERLSML
jgi:RNA polymerase sigma-70 factor (ECF subfamily)